MSFSSRNELSANEMPMYGFSSYEQYLKERTPAIAQVDDDFVKSIIEKKGSKKAAVDDAASLGWYYLTKKGDPSTAMKRCNQAWLIDQDNFNVYWCYGAILGSAGNFVQSSLYFDMALLKYSRSQEMNPGDYAYLLKEASVSFTGLSDQYLKKGDSANAKKYADKVIELDKLLKQNSVK